MKTMAEVLEDHPIDTYQNEMHDETRWICTNEECDFETDNWHGRADADIAAHQAAALTAAGFGPVREAAAAGVRSIYDIWGAGGRRTVRMGEIHAADKTILSGEWDDHVKWNMGDIARERARAAAVEGGA